MPKFVDFFSRLFKSPVVRAINTEIHNTPQWLMIVSTLSLRISGPPRKLKPSARMEHIKGIINNIFLIFVLFVFMISDFKYKYI